LFGFGWTWQSEDGAFDELCARATYSASARRALRFRLRIALAGGAGEAVVLGRRRSIQDRLTLRGERPDVDVERAGRLAMGIAGDADAALALLEREDVRLRRWLTRERAAVEFFAARLLRERRLRLGPADGLGITRWSARARARTWELELAGIH
jgi:hypothetical protein